MAEASRGQGDTPEDAVQRLEAAYRGKDLEAAIAAKDFTAEARLMLRNLAHQHPDRPNFSEDPEIVTKTAEVLELGFRQEIKQNGFPDFTGVHCSFDPHETLADDLVVIHETCTFPDGGKTKQRINVARTPHGWRVLNPLD
jgi:hypothetical protein